MIEPTLRELSEPGRRGVAPPPLDVPQAELPPAHLLRDELPLPEVSELDVVRHFVRLSHLNHAIDIGFYPLGSCTMKYNPKVHEDAARLPGLTAVHPYQPVETVQGCLQLMHELQSYLGALTGYAEVSLQPAAGAHGELTGVLMIRAYHQATGQGERDVMLIPDSAHGTNPASTAMAGYRVVELPSDARGNVDLAALDQHCDEHLAGIMFTNPNTLGLFDEHVREVTRRVHAAGGLVYGDGANLNAIMGVVKPAELGFDVMHFNLHKTFSTPHGGGGPGSGPVGAVEKLAPFLPGPIAAVETGADGPRYHLVMPEQSIGRVKAFYGHFGVLVRAWAYMRTLGAAGLREASETAVLNANYLQVLLKDLYPLPYDRRCMHEFVIEGVVPDTDVRALDIAKRLMDYGVHPPTYYFPLIVDEALMIEPTETESKRTLDAFAEAMARIREEAQEQPELLHEAPHTAPLRRLDEVAAARNPVLTWHDGE
ncbi:MAG: aminomethyl-transferring glycine dehydrogenase subunit GcvPB [Anaerolineae bacterium]